MTPLLPPTSRSGDPPFTGLTITDATWSSDWAEVKTLLHQYAAWVAPAAGLAHITDGQPSAAAELDDPASVYGGDRGRFLVARIDGAAAGTAAVLRTGSRQVELKRVYVVPDARGLGLGSILVDEAVARARSIGARRVHLDTVAGLMDAAVAIYERAGFVRIEPSAAALAAPVDGMMSMELLLD